jgi:hypothetical protein
LGCKAKSGLAQGALSGDSKGRHLGGQETEDRAVRQILGPSGNWLRNACRKEPVIVFADGARSELWAGPEIPILPSLPTSGGEEPELLIA